MRGQNLAGIVYLKNYLENLVQDSEIIKKGEEVISDLLGFLKVDATRKLSMEVDDDDVKFLKVAIEGEDLGHLIGYRGNTLNSFQLIFAQILSEDIKESIPVIVDVNGYRQRRKEYLESLAYRAVREAKESGQNVELPPLNAFERRIIHITLKKEPGVMTESSGEGEDRHIIVKIDDEKE